MGLNYLVEPELRQLIKGCKTRGEADKILGAYKKEEKGRDTAADRLLLARKRLETGAKVCISADYNEVVRLNWTYPRSNFC